MEEKLFGSILKAGAVGSIVAAGAALTLSGATAAADTTGSVITVSGGNTHYAGSTYTLSVDVGSMVGAYFYEAHPTITDGTGLPCTSTAVPGNPNWVVPPAGSHIATCDWTPKEAGTYYVYAQPGGPGSPTTPAVAVTVTAAPSPSGSGGPSSGSANR
ncbi:hypothetical protein GPX89_28795 [Nocardia sp. ET3-3]|uniref:Ig-like domain-containing protein n=1 Tax=Nocardia terrae TaxID=2675851 RepID=A0A7K1V3L6_9NOCA|nr:hypothetical protein [Nocardia terrae]MVU81230.1 hypothetical protein [Nocardia terrae]